MPNTKTHKSRSLPKAVSVDNAKLRIAEYIKAKRGRVKEFFNQYYSGDEVSYRTVHRVLFEGDEDYHNVWRLASEFYLVERRNDRKVEESILKTVGQ